MADPSMPDVIAYVRSSARLLDLTLDDAQVDRVALHLARSRQVAAVLAETPLAPADELAEIFRPAPFPTEDAAS